MSDVPYTDAEAAEARQWSNRHGPPNAWTATAGTAARMIGRLLDERERLRLTDAEREAIETAMNAYGDDDGNAECEEIAAVLSGLLERLN